MTLLHNPYLVPAQGSDRNKGGGGWIEDPCAFENIVLQTRSGPLGAFEAAMAAHLMALFDTGVCGLDDLAAGLNRVGFHTADGALWTGDALDAQLEQSANGLFRIELEGNSGS